MVRITPPAEFLCPLSQEVMGDPVKASDGKIYDRRNIEDWLKTYSTSPTTNAILQNKNLVAILALKQKIDDFKKDKNIVSFQKFLSSVRSGDVQKLKNYNYLFREGKKEEI